MTHTSQFYFISLLCFFSYSTVEHEAASDYGCGCKVNAALLLSCYTQIVHGQRTWLQPQLAVNLKQKVEKP